MVEIREDFKTRFARAIDQNDMKPVDVAKLAGISEATISQYRSGYSQPKKDRLVKLANILRVNPSWLMGLDVPMHDKETTPTKGVKIRIYGRVAAGVPLEMIDDIYDEEEIHPDMLKGGQEYFGLVIHGDSMEPRMKEGDIVIVRKQEDAETGDTVIVTVNGDDATCKKLKKYRDGIELIGTNPSFNPIFFSEAEIQQKPVRILGKVVELRAKF